MHRLCVTVKTLRINEVAGLVGQYRISALKKSSENEKSNVPQAGFEPVMYEQRYTFNWN